MTLPRSLTCRILSCVRWSRTFASPVDTSKLVPVEQEEQLRQPDLELEEEPDAEQEEELDAAVDVAVDAELDEAQQERQEVQQAVVLEESLIGDSMCRSSSVPGSGSWDTIVTIWTGLAGSSWRRMLHWPG